MSPPTEEEPHSPAVSNDGPTPQDIANNSDVPSSPDLFNNQAHTPQNSNPLLVEFNNDILSSISPNTFSPIMSPLIHTPSRIPDSKQNESVNIVVLGDESSYKGRFIASFLNNQIESQPFSDKFTKQLMVGNVVYTITILTSVGQEDLFGVNDLCIKIGDAFMLIFNPASRESFTYLNNVRLQIARARFNGNTDQRDNATCMIVAYGHIKQGSYREVTPEEGQKIADLWEYQYFEVEKQDEEELEDEEVTFIDRCMAELLERRNQTGSVSHHSMSVSTIQEPFMDGNMSLRLKSGSPSPMATIALANVPSSGLPTVSQVKSIDMDIMICGDNFVGKTQIIRRILNLSFQREYYTTYERNAYRYKAVVFDIHFLVNLIDIGGLELEDIYSPNSKSKEGGTFSKEGLSNVQGFVLVYSVTSRPSFTILEALRKKIMSCKTEPRLPMLLLGNKSELSSGTRQVSTVEGLNLARRWGIPFAEISAASNEAEHLDKITETFHKLINDVQNIYTNAAIMEVLGDLDRTGYLVKSGKTFKALNRRWFILKDNMLSYSNLEGQPPKVSLPITEDVIIEPIASITSETKSKDNHFPFALTINGQRMVLIANSENERDAWVSSLRSNVAIYDVAMSVVDEAMRALLWETMLKGPSQRRLTYISSNSSLGITPQIIAAAAAAANETTPKKGSHSLIDDSRYRSPSMVQRSLSSVDLKGNQTPGTPGSQSPPIHQTYTPPRSPSNRLSVQLMQGLNLKNAAMQQGVTLSPPQTSPYLGTTPTSDYSLLSSSAQGYTSPLLTTSDPSPPTNYPTSPVITSSPTLPSIDDKPKNKLSASMGNLSPSAASKTNASFLNRLKLTKDKEKL
eukprot:TRINITY_DN13355_c0_g1_i1.p1 TRINITY_DN13355_c0_g1~~TRINITY_DN13355_c0_g1_i1.p1  ORF type:complete len:854 (-),score=181.71 TRINITY_DN13355_c0_g1_i1:57-2618(-)